MKLTNQETATVLAALRFFQQTPMLTRNHMIHFNDDEPLDNEQIDELCEKINFDGEEEHEYVCVSDEDANIEFPLKSRTLEDSLNEALNAVGYGVLTREEAEEELEIEEEEDED